MQSILSLDIYAQRMPTVFIIYKRAALTLLQYPSNDICIDTSYINFAGGKNVTEP